MDTIETAARFLSAQAVANNDRQGWISTGTRALMCASTRSGEMVVVLALVRGTDSEGRERLLRELEEERPSTQPDRPSANE